MGTFPDNAETAPSNHHQCAMPGVVASHPRHTSQCTLSLTDVLVLLQELGRGTTAAATAVGCEQRLQELLELLEVLEVLAAEAAAQPASGGGGSWAMSAAQGSAQQVSLSTFLSLF